MTLTDRYRRPADLPPRIPVFPLRGAILLPRATLPLNIFEPRYLEMIEAVMSGARVIGILQPVDSDDDDQESPLEKTARLRSVGCAGRVTSYQELDDGRLIITLRMPWRSGSGSSISHHERQLRQVRKRSH